MVTTYPNVLTTYFLNTFSIVYLRVVVEIVSVVLVYLLYIITFCSLLLGVSTITVYFLT